MTADGRGVCALRAPFNAACRRFPCPGGRSDGGEGDRAQRTASVPLIDGRTGGPYSTDGGSEPLRTAPQLPHQGTNEYLSTVVQTFRHRKACSGRRNGLICVNEQRRRALDSLIVARLSRNADMIRLFDTKRTGHPLASQRRRQQQQQQNER